MDAGQLASRIRGIIGGGAAPATSSQAPASSLQPPASDLDLSALNGEWRDECFIVERRFDAGVAYGRERIGEVAERLEQAIHRAPLVGAPMAVPPFVFLDLETTGLSGGAGTQAFLVGLGAFESTGAFVTRQF